MKRKFLLLLSAFIIFIVSFVLYFQTWLHKSIGITPIQYYVEEGSNLSRVSKDLQKEGFISSSYLFELYIYFTAKVRKLKVGTYELLTTDSPFDIVQKLNTGKTILIKVTIPEGFNIYQIAQRLSILLPYQNGDQWLEAINSEKYTHFVKIGEKINNLEGFLFPQTYFLDPHSSVKQVVKNFIHEFNKNITIDLFNKAQVMGLSPLQFITLSSIVEKETSIPSERNKIASVYLNRLKIHMRLQADPTVIYSVWSSYKGSLNKKDLKNKNPYNTYVNLGLPPGPIANPGLESFKAVLLPSSSKDLYFVATGNGGHSFSSSLSEHNKAVRRYLKYLKIEKNSGFKKGNNK